MKIRTTLRIWIGALALLTVGFAGNSQAAPVTWDGSTDTTWGPAPDGTSWSGGTYNNGDTAVFAGAGAGTVTIDAGGVIPGAVNVTSGTYIFAGGDIQGAGNLTKSGTGTLTLGTTYDGLRYTGNTQLDSGTLAIQYSNNNGGGPSQTDRSFGGTTVLNGGTLQFQHTGAGHNNPDLTFTNGITVGAAGGTIDFSGAANNFLDNIFSAPTLGGDLMVSGITGNTFVPFYFTSGTLVLNADASITNATGSGGNAHTIVLSPTISGSTRTLTLDKSGNGTGFQIVGATASSIDLAGLTVGAGASLYISSDANIDVFSQVKSNGGGVTMNSGATLQYRSDNTSPGPIFDPTVVTWQGSNTLSFPRDSGGNRDSWMQISSNLTVSTASGLTQLNAVPWRAYLTIASPHVLTVGDGGTLQWTAGAQVREEVQGNVTLLDGATLHGRNTDNNLNETAGQPGGLIRNAASGGTLTLGDGSASTITVQGNHYTDPDSFNLGWPAANVTDSGDVTLKYANTSATAGEYFNVGWSNGGAYSAALTAFRETSGGTEFAPVAGSAGVAIVGPSSGTVATFAKTGTVTTAGTVGFYNEINTNQRGALGDVQVNSGGLLTITNDGGTVEASTLTVDSGTIGGYGTFAATDCSFANAATYALTVTGAASTNSSLIDASTSITIAAGTLLTVDDSLYSPVTGDFWYVATAPTAGFSGLPTPPAGYSVELLADTPVAGESTLKVTKLASATAPVVENREATDVQTSRADLNGFLQQEGTPPTTVTVYYGLVDPGQTDTGWTGGGSVPLGTQTVGALSANDVALTANKLYFYRFRANNAGGDAYGDPAETVLTGEVSIAAGVDGNEVGPVNGTLTVSRPAGTNTGPLAVNYTVAGSATSGDDYTALSGTVTFGAADLTATITVPVLTDLLSEGTETVEVTLAAGPYLIGAANSATVNIADYPSRDLTWTNGGGTGEWNTTDVNWQNGGATQFVEPDNAIFTDTAAGTVTVVAGGITPADITVNSSSDYTFAGGDIQGAGDLIKSGSGTLNLGNNYTGLLYTGDTRINEGTLRCNYSGSGPFALDFGSGTLALDNGTLHMNYGGTSWGAIATVSNPLFVGSNGGAIDLGPSASGVRRATVNFSGGTTLEGDLIVTGNSWGNTLVDLPTLGTVTLNADAQISNTTYNQARTVYLGPSLVGSTRALTLAVGSFSITGATAASIDVAGLTVGAGGALTLGSSNGINPLAQLKANGGTLTLGDGATLVFLGSGGATGPILDPAAMSWAGNGVLDLPIVTGGNGDSYWRITDDLVVSAASGLVQVNSRPKRGYMTVDASYALIIGDGGTYNLSITSGQFNEYLNGDLKLYDGATVQGSGSAVGGMIRGSSGTLTLGDGSGTPAAPSVVTVQGNHGAGSNAFNLGYGNYKTESGTVRMKYASTSATATDYFNVGWSNGGSITSALVALPETSGGTEFAPVAGSAGLAILGAASGTVAAFTKTTTISTAGTVGFYNETGTNTRGALGAVTVDATGAVSFTDSGTLEASDLTFENGSSWNVTATGTGANDIGYLAVAGTLTMNASMSVTVSNPSEYEPDSRFWYIAEAATITGPLPTLSGYKLEVEAGSPQRLKLLPTKGVLIWLK